MRSGGNPRRAVHVEADVVVTAQVPFARVEAHPHPDRVALRPALPGQSALGSDGRFQRIRGRTEDREEGVTLGADLDPLVRGKRAAHDGRVALQHALVLRAKPLQQARRALDVSEEKRDGAGRQGGVGHRAMMRREGSGWSTDFFALVPRGPGRAIRRARV